MLLKSFLKALPLCFYFLFVPLTGFTAVDTHVKEVAEPVQAKLIAEEESIQPGRPFWVGVELKMAEGWDTYWQNPGDSGFPTKVEWHLPDGFKEGTLLWPYPERFENESLVVYGYTDSVLLMTQITPPKELPSGTTMKLSADVSWLACKDSCMPGNAHLDLDLPVTAVQPEINDGVSAIFAKTREQLPQTLNTTEGTFSVSAQAEQILLNFKPMTGLFDEIEEAVFIPEVSEVIDNAAPQVLEKSEDGYTLNVKRAHPGDKAPTQVKGVLLVSEKGTGVKRAIQIDTSSFVPMVASVADKVNSYWLALGFAFLGGLILNVMPCVLPVIALKIFGFVKMAHEKRSLILKHGGVFAMGVVVSFWVLSGALLLLRAYGEQIGWGFQLQEPVFVVVLVGILFLLGLSLFGVFEMGTSLISLGQKTKVESSPLLSSFMSGVLATLVATPCTGPLLGPALGFAMTLPPVTALSIFTVMGLGMASPYLLFSAFPKLVRYLPKPGNWMIVFKQLMGFLMMATVIWLVWVFAAQTDTMAVALLLAALLLIAIGAWVYGRWASPSRRRPTRVIATIVALAILIVGGTGAIGTARAYGGVKAITNAPADGETWLNYSPEKVRALREEGKAVFVDFTAKWCLTCQANKIALRSSEVEAAFKEKGVVTMVADWTKRDPVITEELEKLGRSGVPVYVLYPANLREPPLILPQTLTAGVVIDYLNKLDKPSTTVHAD